MDTSKLSVSEPQAAVEHELDDNPSAPELLFIDLDLLDDNPFQPRAERDELKAAQLRESIAHQGQLQPILVRRAGTRWQIIFGHGRVEALRKLRSEATSDAERSHYSKVRAEERSNVSDEQMLVLGVMENIQREDISPLDCAAALVRLKSLRPDLGTTEDIAREMRMDHTKVKGLLRLHAAPQVIKDAVSKGKTVLVPIDDEDSDPKLDDVEPEKSAARMQEIRRLDFSSALPLAKLYAHWCESRTDETASGDGTPDQRMAALIDRVLKQDWGVRRVRAEVEKLSRGEAGSPATDESPDSQNENVPFKVNRKKVVIFTSRLAQMDDAQKAELRSVLEPIWNQLGEQMQPQPPPPEQPFSIARYLEAWRLFGEMARHCRTLWRIIEVYVIGKSPLPPDQLPRSVQLPSNTDQRPLSGGDVSHPGQLAEKRPVALLPTGKAEPGAKAGTGGNSHQLSP